MCSHRVALHVTAIRVYIPSLLPSYSLSRAQGHVKEHELYMFLPPYFVMFVTSARFIAQERALVEWSQLRLFKAKVDDNLEEELEPKS